MSRVRPMSRLRKVLLGVYAVVGALVIAIPFGFIAGWPNALTMFCAVLIFAGTGYVIVTWGDAEAAQEQDFLDTYGSLDGARAELDLDALRDVRDAKGVPSAILIVRREHPKIPLAQAAQIIRGL